MYLLLIKKSIKCKKSSMRDFLVVCCKKMNATSNRWCRARLLCISNTKKQSLIDEILIFGCLFSKTTKSECNKQPQVWAIRIKSNTNKSLINERLFLGCLLQTTKINKCNKQPQVWAEVAFNQIKHKKNNHSLMSDCFLVVYCKKQKTWMQQATSGTSGVSWGCFAFKSNQTHTKTSLIDERLLFGCLLVKNKKRMQQATSGVGQGCFAFESNQIKHKKQSLIDERLLFGCLLEKTKKWMELATSGVGRGCFAFKSNQIKHKKAISHRWEISFLFVGEKQKMNATSNHWCGPKLLCIQIESNQTKKSLIDERLLFGCLVWETKKRMQQATSEVALCLNQIKHKKQSLIDGRLLFGCLLQKTKKECNKQPLVWGKVALHLNQIKHKKISHHWEIAFCFFVGEKQKNECNKQPQRLLCIWIKLNTKNNLSLMRDCI